MRVLHAAVAVLCVVSAIQAWNPMKVGGTFPMNRLMLDSDGELTSPLDLLAEGRPVLVASNTTN